jgi:peptide/nickel transport system substrate-binding protein
MTFYGTPATSAALDRAEEVPRARGRRRLQEGAGRRRPVPFVSFTPGVELSLEAYEGYWRKTPRVKRLVFKSVPDESTRLVMLKRGETDIAYGFAARRRGRAAHARPHAQAILPDVSQWLVFTEQWDPKSPWADRRVRLAANLAIDRKAFSDAEYLGYGRPAPSIIPARLRVLLGAAPYPHDPAEARQLLAEAGYPEGLRRRRARDRRVFTPEAEAVINGLARIGIRARAAPLERASFYKATRTSSSSTWSASGAAPAATRPRGSRRS